jgi:uncharacterized protein YoaH (UPF0181 family)
MDVDRAGRLSSRRPKKGKKPGSLTVRDQVAIRERIRALMAIGRNGKEIAMVVCMDYKISQATVAVMHAELNNELREFFAKTHEEQIRACAQRLLYSIHGAMIAGEYHAHASLEDRLIKLLALAPPERLEVAATVAKVPATAEDIARTLAALASASEPPKAIIHEISAAALGTGKPVTGGALTGDLDGGKAEGNADHGPDSDAGVTDG